MSATRPPLEYLITCSQMSLESVELSRLNLAANLRKEFHEILEEWIDSEVDARLARSILEWRRARKSPVREQIYEPKESPHFQQLAIAFLPEGSDPPANDSLEHGPDVFPGDASLAPRPRLSSEIARSNISSPRWTSLAKAAAASFGAIANLDECRPKTLNAPRKRSPTNLEPLRASCDSVQVALQTSSALRSRMHQRNTSVAAAARRISRLAGPRGRRLPSVQHSGAGAALRIAIADVS
jgi:hypothetical protein